jgi:hypothetical protein
MTMVGDASAHIEKKPLNSDLVRADNQLSNVVLLPVSEQGRSLDDIVTSYTKRSPSDLYQLSVLLKVNNKSFLRNSPDYRFLHDTLYTLTKAADRLIPVDNLPVVDWSPGAAYSSLKNSSSAKSWVEPWIGFLPMTNDLPVRDLFKREDFCGPKHTQAFLRILTTITSVSGPSLLELLPLQTRAVLFEVVTNFLYDNEINKLQAVNCLRKTKEYLTPDQAQQLEYIRQNIDLDRHIRDLDDYISKIVLPKQIDIKLLPEGFDYPSYLCHLHNLDVAISILADAVLAESEPMVSQLQKLFAIAKKFPEPPFGLYVLQSLTRAIQLLPKKERHEFFTLTMAIANATVHSNGAVYKATINFFKNVIEKATDLEIKELEALIAFVMEYKDHHGPGHIELLCSLVNAAGLDERLGLALAAVMIKREEKGGLYGCMLEIKQLDSWSRQHLINRIQRLDDQKERFHMLALLGNRMEYLEPSDRTKVLDAILAVQDKLARTWALHGVAANILCLKEADRKRLLDNIEKHLLDGIETELPSFRSTLAQLLRILVGTVSKKLASLSQPQVASPSNFI